MHDDGPVNSHAGVAETLISHSSPDGVNVGADIGEIRNALCLPDRHGKDHTGTTNRFCHSDRLDPFRPKRGVVAMAGVDPVHADRHFTRRLANLGLDLNGSPGCSVTIPT